jgi:predicted nucleotidyltransferase
MSQKSNPLPSPNPAACGLRLTDSEFRGLLEFLKQEPYVSRAWVYGSRYSGSRRRKDHPGPPDIDLAVELGRAPLEDDENLTNARFVVRDRFRKFFDKDRLDLGLTSEPDRANTVDLEFAEKGTCVLSWVEAGSMPIFERPTPG